MADPEPRPGAILLTNTAQVGVNADGYAVLHDPDYLLLEAGTTDAMLLEQGTTDGFLLEPYDCACCGEEGECGECVDAIGNAVTVDLGTTGFNAAADGYYGNCETPCNTFEDEIILTAIGGQACGWRKSYAPFCQRYWYGLPYDIHGEVSAWVDYEAGFGYRWDVLIMFTMIGVYLVRRVNYKALTTTVCTGRTFALSKFIDETFIDPGLFPPLPFLPCRSGGDPDVWEFPATIDLIIP